MSISPFRPRPSPLQLGIFVIGWMFLQLRPARAENAVSYKYADYRESDDRITVESHYGLFEQDLGSSMHLKVLGVIDAISGATPTGQPPKNPGESVPLTEVSDRRNAWSVDLSRQFTPMNVSVGYAYSREDDYVSKGLSLNTLTEFNQKNTTLLLGIAGTDDDIKVFYQTDWAKKHTADFIAGVTQLLNPRTAVTFNFGFGRSTGYHADPYRVIEKKVEVAPGVFLPLTAGENRPAEREKWTALVSVNRAYPELRGAAEASYRFFHDTFGTNAHTIELAWYQKLGERFTLRPVFRWYDQTAADFYRIDLTGTDIIPTGKPMPEGPFYSADYRLSAFQSFTYGLKAIWRINPNWQADASFDYYTMEGKDSVTSSSVYPSANIVNVGLRFSW